MQHLVCIGHAKCGTTLLDSVFRQSRLIATPSETKEIKYFLPRFFPGEAARERYLEKFATADGGHPVVGTFEASPQYSHQPEDVLRAVLENIRRTLPGAKVVICFRHPVLRAYSHYIHNLHTFALYGEGVFTPRPDLLRKPCTMSFEEALVSTTRLQVSYATTLRLAYEVMGRENVLLFFVEKDAASLADWISLHMGKRVADDLADPILNSGTVFGRRPVPGYVMDGGIIHAYGSLQGEYVRYEGGSAEAMESVLRAPAEWTLSLESEDISRLTEDHFRHDLLQCENLGNEEGFRNYLLGPQPRQSAEIAPRALLQSLHGVSAT
jgi:hypothetical protein